MGSLGGLRWYRRHKCPEPYSPESAQEIWDSVVGSQMVISPMMKARLQMSWRLGYAKSRAQRITEEMEQQFEVDK